MEAGSACFGLQGIFPFTALAQGQKASEKRNDEIRRKIYYKKGAFR